LRIGGKSGSSGKARIGVRGIAIVFAARGRDFIASSLENKERNGNGTRIVYAFVAASFQLADVVIVGKLKTATSDQCPS
jgi:hypothetical protein